MRRYLAATFLVAMISATAQAMPVTSLNTNANPVIVRTAGGCGSGWHRGPYGGCLRNYADPAAHACPRGYHVGPGGECKGNGK